MVPTEFRRASRCYSLVSCDFSTSCRTAFYTLLAMYDSDGVSARLPLLFAGEL